MIQVTENWSAQLNSLVWPWVYPREFVVTGTDSWAEASAAVDPVTGVRIPQEGEGHPDNPDRLICGGPMVRSKPGPEYWVIGVQYKASDTGDTTKQEADPLKQPARIQWQHVEAHEPVDRDMSNPPLPILNSGGFPYDTTVSRDIPYKRFRIVKNFPFFDLYLCEAYDNTVSTTDVSLGLGIKAAAHHLRCISVIPAAEFTANAKFVPMAFDFEMYAKDSAGKYPFQHRLMDAGREGWTGSGTNAAHLPFAQRDPNTGLWQPVGAPVRLNGAGVPIASKYPNIRLGDGGNTPGLPPFSTPPCFFKEDLGDAVWRYHLKTRLIDMNQAQTVSNGASVTAIVKLWS